MRLPRRLYGWAGMASPLLVALAMVEATVAHHGGVWWQQSISLFSEGPAGVPQRVAFGVGGVLTGAFSWGLFRTTAPRVMSWSQAGIALGLIVTGAFIQQSLAPGQGFSVPSPWGLLTLVGLIHVAGAGLLYAAIVVSCFGTARALTHRRGAERAGAFSGWSGVGVTVLLLAFMLATTDNGPAGLLERLAVILALTWEAWLARCFGWEGLAWRWEATRAEALFSTPLGSDGHPAPRRDGRAAMAPEADRGD